MTAFKGLDLAAQREFDAMGLRWGEDIQGHRDRVLAVYRPYLAQAPKDGIAVTRDLSYGAHPRQVLDVFQPQRARNVPVVIFIHGGAFVRGDKNTSDAVYANVAYYFARNGCLAINAEYRLAPEVRYPHGCDDLGAVVRWAQANAARFGGDAQRIFAMGHSAGATHLASYVCDPLARPAAGHGLQGIVLVSGRLRADARADNPNAAGVRAYYGDDASVYEAASPVSHAENLDVPVLIAIAEHENPLLDIYGAEFFHRVSVARGRAPRFLQMPRHNHFSIVAHFNTHEDALGREIVAFVGARR